MNANQSNIFPYKKGTNKNFCLLIETTSSRGSLGLYSLLSEKNDIQPIMVKEWEGPSHSAAITQAFESILDFYINKVYSFEAVQDKPNLHVLSSRLAFVALGVGPGRFTGVRVGVSFAKTLSFVLHVPVYPVSSLKILAESQIGQEKPILVLLNAFKNSLYMALYQKKGPKLEELIPPSITLPADLSKKIFEECICVGDAYSVYKHLMSSDLKTKIKVEENIFPEIKYMASLLQREFDAANYIHWKALEPVYLRSPVPLIKPQVV